MFKFLYILLALMCDICFDVIKLLFNHKQMKKSHKGAAKYMNTFKKNVYIDV